MTSKMQKHLIENLTKVLKNYVLGLKNVYKGHLKRSLMFINWKT